VTPTTRAHRRIIAFYSGEEPDDRGRFLREIQEWPDERLESVHDFIQWMFPLTEPSGVNPRAPVLDRETIQEFRSRPKLQENLRTSFRRMQRFYTDGRHWLMPGNHNHLRITRIIKCLRLLGLEAEAQAFYEYLAGIYERERHNITAETFRFWSDASAQVL
jgi:hypothetical protein